MHAAMPVDVVAMVGPAPAAGSSMHTYSLCCSAAYVRRRSALRVVIGSSAGTSRRASW